MVSSLMSDQNLKKVFFVVKFASAQKNIFKSANFLFLQCTKSRYSQIKPLLKVEIEVGAKCWKRLVIPGIQGRHKVI